MEARAQARFVRIAPRKARAVINLIKQKEVEVALGILRYTPQRGAEIISNVLKSAIANAEHNLELLRQDLYVDRAFVDEGPTLKRVRPRARGRRFIIRNAPATTIVVKGRKEG